MNDSIERFYDEFSRHFVDDVASRNERVQQQLAFLRRSIPKDTRSALVVGFGSGESAYFIASRVAKRSHVLGVDISAENLKLAQALFPHQRIEYRKANILTDTIEGQWDVVVLPDVYEHIPRGSHRALHSILGRLLTDRGRILLTLPSAGKQAALRTSGGLQAVDETITLEDLLIMSREVRGVLTFFSTISVWETNDYVHAMIERGAERVLPISDFDKVAIKGWPERSLWTRGVGFLARRLGLLNLYRAARRRWLAMRLRRRAR